MYMKALVYHGPGQRGWDTVTDPTITDPTELAGAMTDKLVELFEEDAPGAQRRPATPSPQPARLPTAGPLPPSRPRLPSRHPPRFAGG